MHRISVLLAALQLILASAATSLAAGSPTSPVVVELFTSQGCSSCPPANANLIELAKLDDVLALSFAVTYWDYLGWKDSFGKPEFTDRQVAYEPGLHQPGPYTPQMVINGTTTAVGNNLAEVVRLIDATTPIAGPQVTMAGASVTVGAGEAPSSGADVWLVQYEPGVIDVPVARGENTGRTLPHTHVVRALQHLGTWTGSAISFQRPEPAAGLRTAILVQVMRGGRILAASTDAQG